MCDVGRNPRTIKERERIAWMQLWHPHMVNHVSRGWAAAIIHGLHEWC